MRDLANHAFEIAAPVLSRSRALDDQALLQVVNYQGQAHIKAGKLRALGVTSTTRWDGLPGIPTVSEFVPDFETSFWAGVGAPRNTPTDIIGTLNNGLVLLGVSSPMQLVIKGAIIVAAVAFTKR